MTQEEKSGDRKSGFEYAYLLKSNISDAQQLYFALVTMGTDYWSIFVYMCVCVGVCVCWCVLV